MDDQNICSVSQSELKAQEHFYQHVPFGYFLLKASLDAEENYDYQMVYVNEQVEEITGISRERFLSCRYNELIPFSRNQEWMDQIYRAAYHGERTSVTSYSDFLHKYLNITAYQHVHGFAACIVKDLTQEQERNVVLNCTVLNYREIIFLNLNVDYYSVVYSQDEEKSTGTYSEEIKRRLQQGMVHTENMEDIRCKLALDSVRQSLTDQDMVEYKYRRRRGEADWEWCLVRLNVSERAGGIPRTAAMTIQSIEELVKKEEEQKLRLEKAAREARLANEAKTEFLSMMSHDIRTPLNAIIGMSEIAGMHVNDREKLLDCIDKISASGRHLLELINQILDMSKIESGRLELNVQPHSIEELLQELENMLHGVAADRQQKFIIEKQIRHDCVLVDEGRLKQVLVNLVSNAMKYSDAGKTIWLKVEEREEQNGQCCFHFTVLDQGWGMSQDFLGHIFEKFTREDIVACSAGGSGLGMPIVKRIVEEMHGVIDIESELGKGTCVKVRIPLLPGAETMVKESRSQYTSTAAAAGEQKKYHVLLVEDNRINTEVASEILRHLGFEVSVSVNGQEAIDRLLKEPRGTYHCVFMDLRMPVMNGIEAAEIIRESFDSKELPIFAMTANAFTEDRLKTREAGMQEHIAKPIDIKSVQQVLIKYFPEVWSR